MDLRVSLYWVLISNECTIHGQFDLSVWLSTCGTIGDRKEIDSFSCSLSFFLSFFLLAAKESNGNDIPQIEAKWKRSRCSIEAHTGISTNFLSLSFSLDFYRPRKDCSFSSEGPRRRRSALLLFGGSTFSLSVSGMKLTDSFYYEETRGLCGRKLLRKIGQHGRTKIRLFAYESWAKPALISHWTIQTVWWSKSKCQILEQQGHRTSLTK